jgi:C1A family cysteine protease
MNNIITPSGRFMGRKPDVPKDTDHKYMFAHTREMRAPRPTHVDLRSKGPPAFDQSTLGSCGPNAGEGMMAYLYPGFMGSRLQLYYDIRELEGDVGEDSGVQTRDVLEVLQKTGTAPESEWPYDITKFTDLPPRNAEIDAAKHKIKSYSRLTTANEYLSCLANGFTFLLGFNVPASFDSDFVAQTGILLDPEMAEPSIGGHDVLAVGYDLTFRESKIVQDAGIDPKLVAEHTLIMRNSWSATWGDNGHFYLSLRYAVDASTGFDAWTGRI